jgi:hypothetical protein
VSKGTRRAAVAASNANPPLEPPSEGPGDFALRPLPDGEDPRDPRRRGCRAPQPPTCHTPQCRGPMPP